MELIAEANLTLLPPQGYLEMLGLMKDARLVLTDSGGIQEETTALGVPCVTLRQNTERPITVIEGTNTIVGTDPEKIHAVVKDILQTGGKSGKSPEFWDGKADDWLDMWEKTNQIPKMVKITLQFVGDDFSQSPRENIKVIAPPSVAVPARLQGVGGPGGAGGPGGQRGLTPPGNSISLPGGKPPR